MTELSPPELMTLAHTTVEKMLGTTLDIVEAMAEASMPFAYDDGPTLYFTFIDQRAWRCSDCDHWVHPIELDDKERCVSCR